MQAPTNQEPTVSNVATLRRIRDRFRARWLTILLHECDQCGAAEHQPCQPTCPYVRAHHYPKG